MTREEYIKRSDLDSTIFRLNFEEKGWEITRGEYKLIDSVLFEMPTYFVPEGECIKREDVLKIVGDMRDLARADVLKDAITKIEELPALSALEREKPIAQNRYVFEFNDKDNSRTWHILCFDGIERYSCKSFNCEEDYKDDAEDYVEEFLKNGGTHYKYNIPWNMYRNINKEDHNGVYVLPNKPLSDLEEYRAYPDPRKEEREKRTSKAYFVDSAVSKNCKNLSESYGEICVKCNKCGRFGEG